MFGKKKEGFLNTQELDVLNNSFDYIKGLRRF